MTEEKKVFRLSKKVKAIAWMMMGTQMAAWAWMQLLGGQLNDRQYVIFCVMLLVGQTGSSIECIAGRAWGTLIVQIYFFAWTLIGMIVRIRHGL